MRYFENIGRMGNVGIFIALDSIVKVWYTENGNLAEIANASGVIQNKYWYDDLGQLTREDNNVTGESYAYTYDNAGNILTKRIYAYSTATTLSGYTGMAVYNYNDADWGDLLTSYKPADSNTTVTISYDDIGNPLNYYNGYTFTWQKGRQLASATNGTNNLSFTYNADGIRTSKTVNGIKHTYLLSGSTIMAEEWHQDRTQHFLIYLYDNAGSPMGMMYRNLSYARDTYDYFLFEKNLQGDIVAVYNSSGTKLLSYTYDAWGNCTVTGSTTTGAQYNPFRYRGYYYDSELGLYYLNTRYYDSTTGRFITADKLSTIKATSYNLTDKNFYAYCDNNPITRKDDGGAFWETVFDIVSLAFSVVDVVNNPTDPWAWAGLVGDAVDLIPFVAGVGEVVKTISTGKKIAKRVGDAYEVAGSLRDVKKFAETSSDALTDIKKLTGSYTIKYKGNHFYDGKGGLDRALHSAMKHSTDNGKDIVSIQWRSASSTRQAFVDEYIRMCKHGGPKKLNKLSYNQIWSPGRKYYFQDTGNYFFDGKDFW